MGTNGEDEKPNGEKKETFVSSLRARAQAQPVWVRGAAFAGMAAALAALHFGLAKPFVYGVRVPLRTTPWAAVVRLLDAVAPRPRRLPVAVSGGPRATPLAAAGPPAGASSAAPPTKNGGKGGEKEEEEELEMRVPFRVSAGTAPPQFIDLGSGTGRVVIEAARAGFAARGVETNPVLLWWAKRAALREAGTMPGGAFPGGGSADFARGDLFQEDISGADVVFAYLPKEDVLQELHMKLEEEAQTGATVAVYGLRLPFWKPHAPPRNDLYVYRKAAAAVVGDDATDAVLEEMGEMRK
jgi:hypothetical protein